MYAVLATSNFVNKRTQFMRLDVCKALSKNILTSSCVAVKFAVKFATSHETTAQARYKKHHRNWLPDRNTSKTVVRHANTPHTHTQQRQDRHIILGKPPPNPVSLAQAEEIRWCLPAPTLMVSFYKSPEISGTHMKPLTVALLVWSKLACSPPSSKV